MLIESESENGVGIGALYFSPLFGAYWVLANPQEYDCSAWKNAWIRSTIICMQAVIACCVYQT